MKRSMQPFLSALFGALVGACAVKSLDRPVTAGDDSQKTIVASELMITTGKFGGPTVRIKPDAITLWSGNGVRTSTITSTSIELADDKDRRVLMNTDFRGGGGFVALDKNGRPRAMLYTEQDGRGAVRLQGQSSDNRAELHEGRAGGWFHLYDDQGDPTFAAP